jgi:hypothetical protein
MVNWGKGKVGRKLGSTKLQSLCFLHEGHYVEVMSGIKGSALDLKRGQLDIKKQFPNGEKLFINVCHKYIKE